MDVLQIEYAPHSSGARRRRVIRYGIWFAVILLLVPAVMRSGPLVWRQLQTLYWQRKAMNYVAPSDQLVLETGTATAAGIHFPLDSTFLPAAPWERLNQVAWPPGRIELATLFLHERRNSRGESRLVAVECQGSPPRFTLIPTVVHPGSVFKRPDQVLDGGMTAVDSSQANFRTSTTFRFFAGQPDRDDPSHFAISFQADGHPFTIDGWLRDDDRLDLVTRPGTPNEARR